MTTTVAIFGICHISTSFWFFVKLFITNHIAVRQYNHLL
nr:MAG TPA: hypothetical protein [Caudoviricetes sp.]